MTRGETFKFLDLILLILEMGRYMSRLSYIHIYYICCFYSTTIFRFEEHKVPKEELSQFVNTYIEQIKSLNFPRVVVHGDTHVKNMILDESKGKVTWWRHQMKTFSALLAICAGNSPVSGDFPAQRPVTRGFDVFFDLRLNKRLSKQSWCWWLETLSCSLWRQSNANPASTSCRASTDNPPLS